VPAIVNVAYAVGQPETVRCCMMSENAAIGRLQYGSDDVEAAIWRERADDRVPVELHVDRADQQVDAAGQLLDRRRVVGRNHVVAPNLLASSAFRSLDVNAVTSQPYAAKVSDLRSRHR
jgi:hypothetical protein